MGNPTRNQYFSENIIIDYLKKEGTDIPKEEIEKMTRYDERVDKIKDFIEDREDFLEYYLDQTLADKAYDILREYLGPKELDNNEIFTKNEFNIQRYLDEDDIREEIKEQTSLDYMRSTLIEQISDNTELQKLLVFKDPGPNTLTLIEEMDFQFIEEPEYQRYYVQELFDRLHNESDVWDRVKIHLPDIDYGVAVEFGLDPYLEAEKFNF